MRYLLTLLMLIAALGSVLAQSEPSEQMIPYSERLICAAAVLLDLSGKAELQSPGDSHFISLDGQTDKFRPLAVGSSLVLDSGGTAQVFLLGSNRIATITSELGRYPIVEESPMPSSRERLDATLGGRIGGRYRHASFDVPVLLWPASADSVLPEAMCLAIDSSAIGRSFTLQVRCTNDSAETARFAFVPKRPILEVDSLAEFMARITSYGCSGYRLELYGERQERVARSDCWTVSNATGTEIHRELRMVDTLGLDSGTVHFLRARCWLVHGLFANTLLELSKLPSSDSSWFVSHLRRELTEYLGRP